MAKIHITQEEIDTEEEFIMFDDFHKVTKWYIGPSENENYVDETRKFLYAFICTQNSFPIFLIMEPYSDQLAELERLFNANGIFYILQIEGVQNKTFPVFKIILKDARALQVLLKETFWMAASNQFFAFSFSDNGMYKSTMKKTLWQRKTPYMLPCFLMKEASTVLKIWHDGQGFNLYTSDNRYKSLESLISYLPEDTIVENKE